MATIVWSGKTWIIADASYGHSPGYQWNPNIPIDSNGYLHLNLEQINGVWYAPMIYTSTTTGYGTYQWVLQGIHVLDPNAVLGLFAYAWQNSHELDIEQGQWGSATNPTWDFMVQPSAETGLKDGVEFSPIMPNNNDVICTLYWTTTGESFTMKDSTGKIIKSWSSTIPVNAVSPAISRAFINLYPTAKPGTDWTQSLLPATNQSYVIKSFSFTPDGQTPPVIPVTPTLVNTQLSLVVPASGPVGTPIEIYGVLTASGVPIPNATINLQVTGGDAVSLPISDGNGYWSVMYQISDGTVKTFTASYGGLVNAYNSCVSPTRTFIPNVPLPIYNPVTTVLPTVDIRMDIITSVIGTGTVIYVKKNDQNWQVFPGAPYPCVAGDIVIFVAVDSKGNVGPYKTVTFPSTPASNIFTVSSNKR